MDAHVISFEASNNNNFIAAVGPDVYDIHSSMVPSVEEIVTVINSMIDEINTETIIAKHYSKTFFKLWCQVIFV